MYELSAIKDKFENIFYVIYYNKKYDELFVIPKYIFKNNSYKKIKNIDEILRVIDYPLIKKSKFLKREAIIFPIEEIRIIYNPLAKLKKILKEPRDEIEKRVKEFIELLIEVSVEDENNFGIGGSILLSLHNSESDMDLAYYGPNPLKVYLTLKKLRESKILDELTEQDTMKLYKERGLESLIDFKTFNYLEKRKIIEGRFKDRIYSIKFLNKEEYEPYKVLGTFEAEVQVKDDSKGFLFPSVYKVEDINGNEYEVIVFKLRYTESMKKGERAIIRGQLEKGKKGESRIIIQSPSDFIKPILELS